jgi:hypothetical protein
MTAVMLVPGGMIQYTIIGTPSDPPVNAGVPVAFNSSIWEQCEATDNLGYSCFGA